MIAGVQSRINIDKDVYVECLCNFMEVNISSVTSGMNMAMRKRVREKELLREVWGDIIVKDMGKKMEQKESVSCIPGKSYRWDLEG